MTEHPEHAALFIQFIEHIVLAYAFVVIIACPSSCVRQLSSFHQTWNRILPDLLQLFNRRVDTPVCH